MIPLPMPDVTILSQNGETVSRAYTLGLVAQYGEACYTLGRTNDPMMWSTIAQSAKARKGPTCLVLFGGGLDAAAMVELRNEIEPDCNLHLLYLDYGAKAKQNEVDAMEYFARKYALGSTIVKIPYAVFPPNPITNTAMTAQHQDDYIPGRNLLIASIAFPIACQLRATQIWLGAAPIAVNDPMLLWARDMQRRFIGLFNDTVIEGYAQMGPPGLSHPKSLGIPLLRGPLLELQVPKEEYVRLTFAREPRLFEVTTSCYQSTTKEPCGQCAHCVYRSNLEAELKCS